MNSTEMKNSSLKLVITIVDYDIGSRAIALCENCGAYHNFCHLGYGTANSTILDYLGLGETRKLVIFTILKSADVPHLMSELDKKLSLSRPGGGITFAVPVDSVGGIKTLKMFLGNLSCTEEEKK